MSSGSVLSPMLSAGAPILCSIASSRFDIGVFSGKARWRPPSSWPEAPPASSTGKGEKVVLVTVAQAAAVEDHRVIEQRAVAVGCGAQLVEERRQQAHVVTVEHRVLIHRAGAMSFQGDAAARVTHELVAELGLSKPTAPFPPSRRSRVAGRAGHLQSHQRRGDISRGRAFPCARRGRYAQRASTACRRQGRRAGSASCLLMVVVQTRTATSFAGGSPCDFLDLSPGVRHAQRAVIRFFRWLCDGTSCRSQLWGDK